MVANLSLAGPASAIQSMSPMDSWIQHLRTLLPPRALAHVGAGAGSELAHYAEWGLSQLVLFEADDSAVKRLKDLAQAHEGWRVHQALIAEFDGQGNFYAASNPRESGLLPADQLRPLWRNLHEQGARPMASTCLDHVLSEENAPDLNWLVVDCLPAAALLRGAVKLLARCDVVAVRVALLENSGPSAIKDASLAEVAAVLTAHGLHQVAIEEERMPLLARAVFVRPPAHTRSLNEAALAAVNVDLEKLAVISKQQRVELDCLQLELESERAAHAQSKSDLTQSLDEAGHLKAELQQEKESSEQISNEATDLQAQLLRERTEHTLLKSDLKQSQYELEQLRAALQTEKAASELFSNEIKEKQTALENLNSERDRSRAEFDQLSAELAAVRALAHGVQSENEELRRGQLQTEHELNDLRVAKAQWTAETTALHAFVADREALTGEIAVLSSQLAATQAAHTTDRQNFESERAALQASLDALQQQVAAGQGQMAELASQRLQVEHTAAQTSAQLAELQRQIDELIRQKAVADEHAAAQTALAAQLHVEITAKDQLAAGQAAELNALHEALVQHQARINALEQQKQAVESSLALTQNHVRHIDAEHERLKAQMADQRTALAERDGQIARLTQELAGMSSKFQDCQRMVTGAEQARRHFDIEMAKAEAQIALIGRVLIRQRDPVGADNHD